MNEIHLIPTKLLSGPITIHVVGAGGNGSQFINGLARLHLALIARGHPFGIQATLFDPDLVTEANVGRQLFSPSDIGQNKAAVLVNRLNAYYGLNWLAAPCLYNYNLAEDFGTKREQGEVDFVVGCVDSAASRQQIQWHCTQRIRNTRLYWLDIGNQNRSGQVVLGQFPCSERAPIQVTSTRLPHVLELFPQLAEKQFREANLPSCSLAEALEKQDLFINQGCTTFALHLLWTFFRHGRLDHHGYFVNMESGTVRPLPIDPATWERIAKARLAPQPGRKPRKPAKKAKPRGRVTKKPTGVTRSRSIVGKKRISPPERGTRSAKFKAAKKRLPLKKLMNKIKRNAR